MDQRENFSCPIQLSRV